MYIMYLFIVLFCYVLFFYLLLPVVKEINLDVLDEVDHKKNTTLSVTLNALKIVLQHCL